MAACVLPPIIAAAANPAAPPRPAPAPQGATSAVHGTAPLAASQVPDPAVLEYLGRYAEAADGVDPLAFAAPAPADSTPAGGDKGKP